MKRSQLLPLLLIGLVVALCWQLGVRLPAGDTAEALFALLIAGLIWRKRGAR